MTDSSAAKLQNVTVEVSGTYNGYFSASASTDANGNYTVPGLPNGSYKVHFRSNNADYINEWYNDKGDSNSADPVSVTAPNDTPGINAVLAKVGSRGSISGTVTDSNVVGIEGLLVAALDLNWTSEYDGITDAQGNYTIVGIPTGTYKIIFYTLNAALPFASEWYNDKGVFNSADSVSVTAPNDTPGINAVLTTGGSISGTVTNSSAAGIEGVQVMLADPTAAMGGLAYSYSLTDAAAITRLHTSTPAAIKLHLWGMLIIWGNGTMTRDRILTALTLYR